MISFMSGNLFSVEFIHGLSFGDLPADIRNRAKACLLDLIGASLGGYRCQGSDILRQFVDHQYKDVPEATIIGAGRKTSGVGAALVNGFTANALDIDDGHRLCKGHPGAVVFPAVLAAAEITNASGRAFLEALVVGYEIAIRTAIIMHRHYNYFHGSGSWGALGAAAAAARLLGLTPDQTLAALGIAESCAPLAPVMRSVRNPAMAPKDGIPWGASAGLSAALTAGRGFTGSPSLLGHPHYQDVVNDLGSNWEMRHLYFKPYPCCRWAQPGIDAVLRVMNASHLKHQDITRVVIHTFTESAALSQEPPLTWETAEYNIRYPVAAAAVFGDFTPVQLAEDSLRNPDVLRILDLIETRIDPEIEAAFPQKCRSRVEIHTNGGRVHDSGITQARGDWDHQPLTGDELDAKFRKLVKGVLSDSDVMKLMDMANDFENRSTNDLTVFL